MFSDRAVLLARVIAEVLSLLVAGVFWLSLDHAFSGQGLLTAALALLLIRQLFISIAALLVH